MPRARPPLLTRLPPGTRERGIHVATVEEPARRSPFLEKIVVHGRGRFDVNTEADLFGAQLSAQLRAARQHTMIICNKTIANELAYAWLVLSARQAAVMATMEAFCRAWAPSTTSSSTAVTTTPRNKPAALPRQSPGPAICRRPQRRRLGVLEAARIVDASRCLSLTGIRCHQPLRAKVAPCWTAQMMAAVYWTVSDGSLPGSTHTSWEHLAGSPIRGSPSQWPGSNANPMRVCALPGFRW